MVRLGWTLDPARLDALERISRAMKAAKAAKKRGFNVQQVRDLLKHASQAWTAKNYATATELANQAMILLGETPLP